MDDHASEILQQALALEPEQRDSFVRTRCGGDESLRLEIMALLQHAEGATGFLESPTSAEPPAIAIADDSLTPIAPGTRVGSYTIESVLGVGGMGAVYLARQDQPARTIALKLVKPGHFSERARRRFELETEILARLEHPGIARLYDAGLVDGSPYFAMELVRGLPLTEHADRRDLSTRDRLKLFARICDAVQHAHAKGIVHRDLKPANILVDAETDPDNPQPKVLDFGVARLTDSDTRNATLQTEIGQIVGTVQYMSPEQAAGDPADIDTRSDVYGLGVVLYELLAGRLPHDLHGKLLHEALRVIREDDHTRLSSVDRSFQGDVETIVAKALEKDKERRYQNPTDLASDVRRFLADEPISARPPSTWYQLRKFTKRNTALVAGVAAAFAALLVGLAGTTYFLVEANTQRALAEQRETEANEARDDALAAQQDAEAARAEEARRAQELQQVAEFQSGQFDAVVPEMMGAGLRDAIVDAAPEEEREQLRDVLGLINFTDIGRGALETNVFEPAIETIGLDFAEQPLVQAQLDQAIANSLRELGMLETATRPQERALLTRRAHLDREHENLADSVADSAMLQFRRGRLDEALSRLHEALELQDGSLGRDAPRTLVTLTNLGAVYKAAGQLQQAERYTRETHDRSIRVLGEHHPETLTSMNNMGDVLGEIGRFEEALGYVDRSIDGLRALYGDHHRELVVPVGNRAALLVDLGRYEDAEPAFRLALKISLQSLGEHHPSSLLALHNLGYYLLMRGRLDEAIPYFESALAGQRRVLGRNHPDTLVTMNTLSSALVSLGRTADAMPLVEDALEISRAELGPSDPRTLDSLHTIGYLYHSIGRFNEAEPYCREAVQRSRAVFGDQHPDTISSIQMLAAVLANLERFEEARALHDEVMVGLEVVYGPEHPQTLAQVHNLGHLLHKQGLTKEAEPIMRRALEGRLRTLGAEHFDTLISRANLGMGLKTLGRWQEAEQQLTGAYDGLRSSLGDRHPVTLQLWQAVVGFYLDWHEAEPDAGHDVTAAEWQARLDALVPRPEADAGSGPPLPAGEDAEPEGTGDPAETE